MYSIPQETDPGQAGLQDNGSSIDQIEIPELNFPSGGGSIKGIDEKFKVNTANGTAHLTLPLPLSSARNNFTPALSLNYNSGSGNSVFGLGWDLNLPSIRIRTDKALPQYQEGDIFQLSGIEDLTPSSAQAAVSDESLGYNVQLFHPRTEGGYSKIEKIDHPDYGVYWKITDSNYQVTFFGRSYTSRIADPNDDNKIFEWLPEFSYDHQGNWIKYFYKEENLENVPAHPEESHRLNGNARFTNRYLKSIQYGNKKAYFPNQQAPPYDPEDPTENSHADAAAHFFELVFDYGEHDEANPLPAEQTDQQWSCREDAFSSYRPGFEIRTYRLCKRVLLFHKFPELGATPCLVRSLDFAYTPSNINQSGQSETTYLTSATRWGYQKLEEEGYQKRSFPPVQFEYSTLNWDWQVKKVALENLANAPAGLNDRYRWVDLYGEGVSGILTEQANAWYYKQNLGNSEMEGPRFSAASQITVKPSISGLNNGAIAIQDLEANGRKQLSVNTPDLKGYYALHTEEEEALELGDFTAFSEIPNVDWKHPDVRFIDLNGDGKPELVLSESAAFIWYENRGKAGFAEGKRIAKELDEKHGPAIVFSDKAQSIFLADMSGDGLTDIVRIRNGEICYWPNKGYGNFGAKVNMGNAPLFETPDQFNPKFLHLADVSGTGATDIIYQSKNQFKAFINLSGNKWSTVHEISPFISIDNTSVISVIDLLGNGTSCIVWSSSLPDQHPMQYIDLMGGQKPHLMTAYSNGMGKEIRFHYKSSTHFYLTDKQSAKPWITRLPFPVQLIAKTVVTDHITASTFSTSYRYHHGYYDHEEREFRGFGMVEQLDHESFSGSLPENKLDTPPVFSKTWVHTGAYHHRKTLSREYAKEYYQDDHLNHILPESVYTEASSANEQEWRQAMRALRGMVLRQEIYTLDGSEQEHIPYSIAESNYTINQVQAPTKIHPGVFQVISRESLSYASERNTADPRISHQVVLRSDIYGFPLENIQIAYARSSQAPEVYAEQQQIRAVLGTARYEHETIDYYRLGVLTHQQSFEINGLQPPVDGIFSFEHLLLQLNGILEDEAILLHHESFTTGVQARLTGTIEHFYKSGALKPLALPDFSQQMIMSEAWVGTAFDGKVNTASMETAGYTKKDNHWWKTSNRPSYQSAEGFFLPFKTTDLFGNITSVNYDPYQLLVLETTDALGNTARGEADYRTLSIRKLTDINNNVSEIRTDALGLVIASTSYGTENGMMKGDLPVTNYQPADQASLEQIINQPLSFLQGASSFFHYHLEPWEAGNTPPHIVRIQREAHISELQEDMTSPLQIHLAYMDGFGRKLQSKIRLEGGEWLVSGRTIYNNKGLPVKQYEPFIVQTHHYQTESEIGPVGVTPILYYDPLGRLIKTETPDGFFTKVEFDPWQIRTYDQNDTVLDSRNYQENNSLTNTNDPLGIALDQAAPHYDTPTVTILDSLGRGFLVMNQREQDTAPLVSASTFDIQGNVLTQTDPRQYQANLDRPEHQKTHNFTYTYDLAGNTLRAVSQDSGTSYHLIDAAGRPLWSCNARDYQSHAQFDALHRITQLNISGPDLHIVAQRMVYGTDRNKNQNGQLIRIYDQAGKTENLAFNFKGQLLDSSRQLCRDFKSDPDWESPDEVPLENEIFRTSMAYDALGRVIRSVQADGSVQQPVYYASGWMKSVRVQLREHEFGLESSASETPFVEHIEYNARGQRTRIRYGNGVRTDYTYEDKTFRLTRLLTTRTENQSPSTVLQDISYSYDPVGNLLQIKDQSHKRIFTAGQTVASEQHYLYDALYQLKEATGREHLSLSRNDFQKKAPDFKASHFARLNDARQLRNYTRKYHYDDNGNLIQMRHIGENPFTRNITVAPNSNRAVPEETLNTSGVADHFDAAGNILALNHLAGIQWDYRNQIASATIIERDGENDAEYYVYDGAGQRTRKVKETYNQQGDLLWTEEKLYLGGLEIKRKRRGNHQLLQEERSTIHVSDGSRRIALVHYWSTSQDTDIITATHKVHYQLDNHLGSAALELDHKGLIISYEEYFPFGGTSFTTGRGANEVQLKAYRYVGKERDDTTGLYYYGARYYAPWLGRWLNPDPAGTVDGLNLYRYVRNNPLIYTDPDGQEPEPLELGKIWESDILGRIDKKTPIVQQVTVKATIKGQVVTSVLDGLGRDTKGWMIFEAKLNPATELSDPQKLIKAHLEEGGSVTIHATDKAKISELQTKFGVSSESEIGILPDTDNIKNNRYQVINRANAAQKLAELKVIPEGYKTIIHETGRITIHSPEEMKEIGKVLDAHPPGKISMKDIFEKVGIAYDEATLSKPRSSWVPSYFKKFGGRALSFAGNLLDPISWGFDAHTKGYANFGVLPGADILLITNQEAYNKWLYSQPPETQNLYHDIEANTADLYGDPLRASELRSRFQ